MTDPSHDSARTESSARPGSPEGRVGSLFIRAFEPTLGGDAVETTLRLRAPLDPARLARAYERQLRARPGLRVDYVEHPPTQRFLWEPIAPDDFEARLARALDVLAVEAAPDAPFAPAPDAPQLPYRLLRLDAHTVVMQLSHVLANASGGLFWLEDLLGFYARDDDRPPPLPSQPAAPPGRRQLRAAVGVFWSTLYLVGMRWRAGRRPAAHSVDLAPGELPAHGRIPGYGVLRAVLSREDSARLLAASRARGWTLTAHLLGALARAAFAVESRGRRLLIVVTTDRRRVVRHDPFTEPGNTTGSITVQLLRGRPLGPQLRAVQRAMRRGVAYWANRALDGFVRDELELSASLPAELLRPMAKRGAFECVGCVLTNLGAVADDSRLAHDVEWLTAGSRAIMPLLVIATVAGRSTLQLTWPDALCDAATQRALFDGLLADLEIDAHVECVGPVARND